MQIFKENFICFFLFLKNEAPDQSPTEPIKKSSAESNIEKSSPEQPDKPRKKSCIGSDIENSSPEQPIKQRKKSFETDIDEASPELPRRTVKNPFRRSNREWLKSGSGSRKRESIQNPDHVSKKMRKIIEISSNSSDDDGYNFDQENVQDHNQHRINSSKGISSDLLYRTKPREIENPICRDVKEGKNYGRSPLSELNKIDAFDVVANTASYEYGQLNPQLKSLANQSINQRKVFSSDSD